MAQMARRSALRGWLATHYGSTTQRIFWLRWATIALVLGWSILDGGSTRLGMPMPALALAFGLYNLAVEVVRHRAGALPHPDPLPGGEGRSSLSPWERVRVRARVASHSGPLLQGEGTSDPAGHPYGLVALADVPVAAVLLALCGSFTCPLLLLFFLSACVAALSMETGPALHAAALTTLAFTGTSLVAGDWVPTPALARELALRSSILLVFSLASVALVRQWTGEHRRALVASAAARRLALLNELVRLATAAVNLDEVMDIVVHLTRQALRADWVSACLLEASRDVAWQWTTAAVRPRQVRVAELSLPSEVLERGQPVLLAEARAAPGDPGGQVRSTVAAPLLAEGRVLGALAAHSRTWARFGARELVLLKAIAEHVVSPVEKARLSALEHEHAQRLMELEQAKSNFLVSASHELRTPLTTIKLVSGLLSTTLEGVGEQDRGLLESLARNTARLERLVDELIDAARLQSGALRLEPERVELRLLVREAVAGARQRLGLGARRLEVVLPPEDVPLLADRSRLVQVLMNLLSVADARAPAGTPLAVTGRVEAARVRVDVADQGPLLPPEDLERLFAPFAGPRPDGAARPSGSGLTLAVARMVVELHGGQLGAENRTPTGVTFHLSLPVAGQEAREDLCAS